MKISNYIQSLLPSFSKDRVLEDCRMTRTEIKEITLPMYDSATTLLKGYKFKSDTLKGDVITFNRLVKGNGNDLIVGIQKGLKAALENLDEIEALCDKIYNEDVAGLGLTYMKANLLQFTECLSFVSRYSRKYLRWVYVVETAENIEDEVDLTDSMMPAEIEWLRANFVNFCSALNVVSLPTTKVTKALNEIPDVVVTEENAKTLPATLGESKIDPFAMGLIPIALNPIYHIGLFVAEWQANRYKAAKEEKKLVELRYLNLKRVLDGKRDARIEKEIEVVERRLNDLNYKIAKMEGGK